MNDMVTHVCKQEREIGEITAILGKISKEIYGNGDVGLAKTVPRLEDKINNLNGSVAAHTKVISDFITFQAKHNGEEHGKKEEEERERDAKIRERIAEELRATQKRDKTQRIFLFVMAGLVFAGICVNVYLGFRNSQKIDTTKTSISSEIKQQEGISKVTRSGYVKYNEGGLSDSVKLK